MTELTDFATGTEKRILDAIASEGSERRAAARLGLARSTVHDAVKRARDRAARQGYSPEHDLRYPVAPGFVAKGHSTLYHMRTGEPVLQWVKTTRDMQAQEQLMRDTVQALMQDVPRAKPIKQGRPGDADLCNVYTLTDCHVGLKAWGRETGIDWDLGIAEDLLTRAFAHVVRVAPPASRCVVAQLGDFLHFDSLVPETPTNRHPLDADSRYSKVVRTAINVLRTVVAEALRRHDSVDLLVAEGNHDMAGSVWLRQLLEVLYENEPRLRVIDGELPYYAIRLGRTMLGWHHGHLRKPDQLPAIFAAQFAETWGLTTRRYIHTGHLHHVYEREHHGCHVIQHPTLAARDSFSARSGYISDRSITSITYHAEWGQVARTTVVPEMLEAR